jgi:GNAT superfamily N-acetyltransferase
MENLAMSVSLKNLSARRPTFEDEVAISELIRACDIAEYGIQDSSVDDLKAILQKVGFHLESDAWVITTHKGQIVGFACVWHQDYEEIHTFVCVHPHYRKRGIGTLLLRLVELRAREKMRCAREDARVILRAMVSGTNIEARNLFEREGYTTVREFWRVVVTLDGSTDSGLPAGKMTLDLDVDSRRLIGTSPLFDRDGIYSIRQYYTYEKELRSGAIHPQIEDELQPLSA